MEKNKYIKIVKIEEKSKTNVYKVVNKLSNDVIGIIKWACNFRKYAYMPYAQTQYDTLCLKYISDTLVELMEEHKKSGEQDG